MLAGKRILLIVGGGIAAYKSLELVRLIRKAGGAVVPVLTRAGAEFVTPLSLSALAGAKVHSALFDLTEEAEMGHIQLSRAADLLVVAPATADLMAKMAQGRAEDLASTLSALESAVLIDDRALVREFVGWFEAVMAARSLPLSFVAQAFVSLLDVLPDSLHRTRAAARAGLESCTQPL